jgi:hypothetical protein
MQANELFGQVRVSQDGSANQPTRRVRVQVFIPCISGLQVQDSVPDERSGNRNPTRAKQFDLISATHPADITLKQVVRAVTYTGDTACADGAIFALGTAGLARRPPLGGMHDARTCATVATVSESQLPVGGSSSSAIASTCWTGIHFAS